MSETPIERDEVFEEQLRDKEELHGNLNKPCDWCGHLLGKLYTIYRITWTKDPYHFCSRDHARKWWDDKRQQFPGRKRDDATAEAAGQGDLFGDGDRPAHRKRGAKCQTERHS